MQPSNDPTTQMETRTDPEARDKVHALMAKAKAAMFGTYDAAGNAHSRPMVATGRDGDALWFFARRDSRKVSELAADPRVTLDYADWSDQAYVSATGRAEVLRDQAKVDELWSEPLRTWFPDGPGDPAIALIRVELDGAEYWDAPSSAMVHAFGYVRARLTGSPPSPGDTVHVEM